MPENRNCYQGNSASGPCRETVCMDVNRVLDSCRDKDCYENVRVQLTDCGQELIERACSVRAAEAKLLGAELSVSPVAFNRGFYSISVRYFVKITCDCCFPASRSQQVEGICVCDKQAILYGGEGNVHIFRSDAESEGCGGGRSADLGSKIPSVICETVDPVILSCTIETGCKTCGGGCGCGGDAIPESILSCLSGCLCGREEEKSLCCSLGFFSVLRIERPCQCLVSATEYSVPDKVCSPGQNDSPCEQFARMAFPISEFATSVPPEDSSCGCKRS